MDRWTREYEIQFRITLPVINSPYAHSPDLKNEIKFGEVMGSFRIFFLMSASPKVPFIIRKK